MPRTVDPTSRRKGTHRSIYFSHEDVDILDHLDQLVLSRDIPSVSWFIQQALRTAYKRKFQSGALRA